MIKRFVTLFALACVTACGSGEKPAEPSTATATPSQTTTTAEPTPAPAETPTAIAARAERAVPVNALALWLAADELVSVGPENVVTMWRSQNNTRASQTEAGGRPRLYPNAINGKPAVRFDGQDDRLETNVNINPTTAPNVTIVVVFNSRGATRELRKVYGHDDGGFDRAAGLDDRAAESNYAIFGGSASVRPYFALEANRTYVTVDAYSPTAVSGWVNGAKRLDNVAAQHGTGLPQLFLGALDADGSEPWAGDIAEVLVYQRALTDTERMQIEDYLAAKYAVQLTR